jgi:hypothetical protein
MTARLVLEIDLSSGKRKKNRLQIFGLDSRLRPQFFHRPASHDLSVNEKKKSVADPRGIRKLMNRKKERAPGRGLLAKKARYFNCLPRVESIEGFVQKEERLGREQGESEENSSAVAARQFANASGKHVLELETSNNVTLSFLGKAIKITKKSRKPERRLLSIRNDLFRKIEHQVLSLTHW